MSDDEKARLIKAPTTLNKKVTIGGPGAVDAAALERAEQVITKLAVNYLDWAREDLAKLQSALVKLKSGEGDMSENLDAVFQLSHDIKGQGGSFEYNLMTIIGNQLCRYIEHLGGEATAPQIEVIEIHVNALHAVIKQKLKGDGGPVGDQLLSGLEMVFEKRSKG